MSAVRINVISGVIAVLVTIALAGTANAAPPDHAGGPKHKGHGPEQSNHAGKHNGSEFHNGSKAGSGVVVFFDTHHRDIIRDYYHSEFNAGHCPPGLAKKHNGCMPPGQAKKWHLGQRLPGDLIYYDLPHDLAVRLGYENPAYKLIRVGGDILRIGVGTGIVVEAVQNLGGLF